MAIQNHFSDQGSKSNLTDKWSFPDVNDPISTFTKRSIELIRFRLCILDRKFGAFFIKI
jgi:hypothetical protein